MVNVAGSGWVEGTKIHWLDQNAVERSNEGTDNGTPANAVLGSPWVEGDYLHYIDANGDERICDATSGGAPLEGAVPGSGWVETANDDIGYINENADEIHYVQCGCPGTVPTFTGRSNTENHDTCANGGMCFTVAWTVSDQPIWAAFEVWRCTTDGCSNFVFWKRLPIATLTTDDDDPDYGTDGPGASTTFYRNYQVRIVPACSANGAGPFCRTDVATGQKSETLESCVA